MGEGEIWRSHPALTTAGFGGMQAVFTLFSSQAVTHLKTLGLQPSEITITLLSGPVCGAIFQPYFGSWSDRYQSRWGRRRPFIIIGTVVVIISVLSLAWVDKITQTISSSVQSHKEYRTSLVILTVLLAFTTFTAIQAVQVNLRALLTDNCTRADQDSLNAWAGIHINFAAVLTNLTALFNLFKYTRPFGKTLFASTSILSTAYIAIAIATTCWTSEEETSCTLSIRKRVTDFKTRWRVLSGLPSQIRTICLVQFLAWLGWFPFLFFVVTYVDSLKTSPIAAESDIGSLVPLIYTTVALFSSMILYHSSTNIHCQPSKESPMLLNWSQALTPRNVWSISHGIFAISMFGTFWVQSAVGTIILFSIVGFSWAITCRIPYHLLHDELCRSPTYENGRSEDFEDSQGLIHGIHNFSICLAQIFVLLIINIVWTFTSTEDGDWFLVWFLRLGGVCALLAMYLTSRLRDLQHVEYEEISMEEVSSETLD